MQHGEVRRQRTAQQAAWIGLVVLTAAAVALRLVRIGVREAWLDEACTSLFAQSPDLSALLDTLRTESHPPLYYLLMFGWVRLFGASEVALRVPSVLAGAALVPLVVWAVRRHGGGLLAAGLGALVAAASPLLLYYSVEAKAYTLLWSLALATVLLLHRATDGRAKAGAAERNAFTGAAALLVAALYTHHFALFLLPLWPVAVLGAARRVRAHGAIAGLVALALWAPWSVGFLGEQAAAGGTAWLVDWQTDPLAALAGSARVMALVPPFPRYLGELGQLPVDAGVGIALGIGFGVPVLLGLLAAARAPGAPLLAPLRTTARRSLLPLLLVVPPLGAALVSLWRPLYLVGRYELIAYPAWIALWALGLDLVIRRPARRATLVALRTLAIAATIAGLAALTGPYLVRPGEPWLHREAARTLAAAAPDEAIVVVGLARAPLEHQLRALDDTHTLKSYPPDMTDHPGWFTADRYDRQQLLEAAAALTGELKERPAVWLVTPLAPRGGLRDPDIALAIFGALRQHGRTPGPPMAFGLLGIARFE